MPNKRDEDSAALREIASRMSMEDAGWMRLLVLLNLATTFEAVKRGAVHDARNQLHTIMMSARAVADSISDESSVSRLLPLLVDASMKLEQTFQRLDRASSSDIEASTTPVALRGAIDSVVAAVPKSRQVYNPPISVDLPSGLPAAYASEDGLQHVLLNLILNARNSLAQDGVGEIRISARLEGDYVCLTVEDDGRGIPEKLATKVLEPFFTTDADKGCIGLGLTVGACLVEAWGGSLEVDRNVREEGGGRLLVRLRAASRRSDNSH